MPLTPVSRRLVPDEVYDQLLGEVVEGGFAPGEALPSERRLSEMLGVSRPAVREALQRLGASRLLDVRHGGGTTVRDFRQYAGLDLLPHLLVRHGELDPAVARSIVEARLAIGPQAAGLAARRSGRAPEEQRQALTEALETLRTAGDPVARQVAALGYWDALVALADSIVFRMLFNNLRHAYEPALEALAPLLDGEVSNHAAYDALAEAVLAGREDDAVAAGGALLRPASAAMIAFFDDYADESSADTPPAATTSAHDQEADR